MLPVKHKKIPNLYFHINRKKNKSKLQRLGENNE